VGEAVGRLLTDDVAIDGGICQSVEEGRGMVGRMEEGGGVEERHRQGELGNRNRGGWILKDRHGEEDLVRLGTP